MSGGGHFCGICPSCWNRFWNYKMYVWCRYACTRAHGVKIGNFEVFNSGYVHDRNISIFRRWASTVTGNTLTKPKYASVRQSGDSLRDRDRDNVTKKVAAALCFETAGAKKVKKFMETCFLAHYYACKLGWNRLRIDRDIREKPP